MQKLATYQRDSAVDKSSDVKTGFLMINTEQHQRRRSSVTILQPQQSAEFPRGHWYELSRRPPTPCRVQQRRHSMGTILQQPGLLPEFSLPPINESGNIISQKSIQELVQSSLRKSTKRYIRANTNNNPFQRRVKITVYAKPSNPYLVLFSSDNKYAVPVAHFKLRQFDIVPVNSFQFKLAQRRVAPDAPAASIKSLIFTAADERARDEWLELLQPLTHVDDNVLGWGDHFVIQQRIRPRALAPILPSLAE